MDLNDPKIVQLIAQEVMRVLNERSRAGGVSSGAAPTVGHAAEIHPPIGICTGDYSKFPELAGKLYPAGKPMEKGGEKAKTTTTGNAPTGVTPEVKTAPVVATPVEVAKPAPEPVALTGIITANQLQAAIDASADGTALLAANARLSPLANDLARKLAGKIRRVGAASAASAPGSNTMPGVALPWMWWIDGHCPVVQDIMSQNRDRLRPVGSGTGPSALSRVVRDLSGALKTKQVAGGLLFVHNAARAACFANRCASIRAVVGTCGEAVEQGIADLGANVLIIEYPHHGYRSMNSMIERILQQTPKSPTAVERDLADLHRCG